MEEVAFFPTLAKGSYKREKISKFTGGVGEGGEFTNYREHLVSKD